MNNPPLFDLIFGLWDSDVDMARDMGVTRHCARQWIARGCIPMAHWPRLTNVCATKFDHPVSYASLVAARLARQGEPSRKVRSLGLYPKQRAEEQQAETQAEAA